MRTVLYAWLAALLLAALPAQAQIVWPPEPAPFTRGVCDSAQAGGTGTASKAITSIPGFEGYYYFCPRESTYGTRYVVLVRRTDYQLKLPDAAQFAAMTNAELIAEVWRRNAGVDCRRLPSGSEFAPICSATIAAADADPARPVPVWKVSGSGSLTTRATYIASFDDAGVATWMQLTDPRVSVGDPCSCSEMAVKAGSQTRCPLASGATVQRSTTLSIDGVMTPATQRLRVWAQCSRQ